MTTDEINLLRTRVERDAKLMDLADRFDAAALVIDKWLAWSGPIKELADAIHRESSKTFEGMEPDLRTALATALRREAAVRRQDIGKEVV